MTTYNPKSQGPHHLSRRRFLLGIGASLVLGSTGFPRLARAQNRPIKVGIILPEQGPFSQDARSLMAGFDCSLKEKGASGIQVIRRDPGAKDEKTLEILAQMLVVDKVDFVISPMSLDGAEKAVHGVSNSSAILFVTNPSVKLVAGELCQPRTFRVRPNTYQRSAPLTPWAIQNLGRLAFITGPDDKEGNETADFFAYSFDRSGGTFGDRVMVPLGSDNFRSVIDAIEKTKNDVIFAGFGKKDALGFLRAIDSRKHREWLKRIVGPDSLVSYPAGAAALGKAAEGVKTLGSAKNPAEFVQRIRKTVGVDVQDVERAAEGYDIASMVALSVKGVSWDAQNPSPLIAYLENLSIQGPRGVIAFDKNHEPILDMAIREWSRSPHGLQPRTLQEIPGVRSLDFGCGKVGFPQKPSGETKEEGPLWEDLEE
ncbi:MAG: ABC transporter substrate-binding protein [Desulfomonilaceae bacterium]